LPKIEPTILSPTGVDIDKLDSDAVRATQRLASRGYEAFLVGGCVRDHLLDRSPKDYDIATSARPQQVKRTFPRNCRIIGRRFKLAHLHFDRNTKILEVSTFRRTPEGEDTDDLLITRDNEFGTAEQDALRRDFTVNALFFDPTKDLILDWCDGLTDLENRVIRTIGDPVVRFREDPVRILRAAKFAGRLGFSIEPETFAAMAETAGDLVRAAPPRVLEEILRLLRGGHALDSFQLLRDVGALKSLVPVLADFLGTADRDQRDSFWHLLEALDRRVLGGSVPQNAILLGVLMVGPVLAAAKAAPERSPSSIAEELLGPLGQELKLPRRDAGCMKRMCGVQHRFVQGENAKRFRTAGFVHGPYFAEALELFELRVNAEAADEQDLLRWQELAGRHGNVSGEGDDEAAEGPREAPKRRRRRRSRQRPGDDDETEASDRDATDETHSETTKETAGRDQAADDPGDGDPGDGDAADGDAADGESPRRAPRRSRRRRSRARTSDDETPADSVAARPRTAPDHDDAADVVFGEPVRREAPSDRPSKDDPADERPADRPFEETSAETTAESDEETGTGKRRRRRRGRPDGESLEAEREPESDQPEFGQTEGDAGEAGSQSSDDGRDDETGSDGDERAPARRRRRRRRGRGGRGEETTRESGGEEAAAATQEPDSEAEAEARPRRKAKAKKKARPARSKTDKPKSDRPKTERGGAKKSKRRERRRSSGPRDVDVVPRSRDRRGKVEIIEPPPMDVSAFDVELDAKRVPTFGTIVEGKGRPKRRTPRIRDDGTDDYKPPPPPGGGDAPPPPRDPPDSDTFGDW